MIPYFRGGSASIRRGSVFRNGGDSACLVPSSQNSIFPSALRVPRLRSSPFCFNMSSRVMRSSEKIYYSLVHRLQDRKGCSSTYFEMISDQVSVFAARTCHQHRAIVVCLFRHSMGLRCHTLLASEAYFVGGNILTRWLRLRRRRVGWILFDCGAC